MNRANSNWQSRSTHAFSAAVLFLGLICGAANVVSAEPILPGFDGLVTPASVGSSVDTGFFGVVPLEGVPLPGVQGVDTIIARLDNGPPEGGTTVIDIELVALHLVSIDPVDIGGGNFADLHVTVDASDRFFTAGDPHPDGTGTGPSKFDLPLPDGPLDPSIGKMEITHGGPGPHTGGTFRAAFGESADVDPTGPLFGLGLGVVGGGIHAQAIFTVPGGDPSNPPDVLFSLLAPSISLASNGAFEHIDAGGMFPTGNFVVVDIDHVGPHPPDPNPDGPIGVPEPCSLALMVFGLAALLGFRRPKRR